MTVYFIGGASASGKSTTAMQLGRRHDIKVLQLDQIYNALDGSVEQTVAKQIIRPMSLACVSELIELDETYIVEGGWISVEKAVELRHQKSGSFRAVYCGYPNADVRGRLAEMTAQKEKKEFKAHWTTGETKDPEQMISWLEKQRADSANYKRKSEASGFLFIDFTDFKVGALTLTEDFESWLSRA